MSQERLLVVYDGMNVVFEQSFAADRLTEEEAKELMRCLVATELTPQEVAENFLGMRRELEPKYEVNLDTGRGHWSCGGSGRHCTLSDASGS